MSGADGSKHRLTGYTADEFLADYLEGSGLDSEEFLAVRYVAPCECGDELCTGWAMEWKADLHG